VILVVLDVLSRDALPYRRIDQGHILTARFGVILIGFVGEVILLSRNS
jgi:cation:H+ antiporter